MNNTTDSGNFVDLIYDFFHNFGSDIVNSITIGNTGMNSGAGGFGGIVGVVLGLLNFLVIILIGLAVLYFLWGVFRYVKSEQDSDRQEAVKTIGYGLIIIFVMVSLWSLVSILGKTFNLGYNGTPRTRNINVNSLIK